jgi:hypothetical protein
MRKKGQGAAKPLSEAEARKLGKSLARSPYRKFEASDLISRRLTVGDIAAALAPIAPDVAGTVQRIRHWTRERVLQPIASEHSGTGKHRQYNPVAVYQAAVLHVLTLAGLPVSNSRFLDDVMRNTATKAIEWITASDRASVFKLGPMVVTVTVAGKARVGYTVVPEPDAPGVVLTISIDLAKLFAQVDHGRS